MNNQQLRASRTERPHLPKFPLPFRSSDAVLPLVIVVIGVIATILEPRFFSVSNLVNLSRQLVPLLIISVGQSLVIMRGGLDLSMSSVLSLSGVAGVIMMPELGIYGGIAVMLAVGVMSGLVSGFIIAWFRTTPLVVTLGMLSVTQALALTISNGVPIYDVPSPYVNAVGFATIAGIPTMVWIAAGLMIVSWFLLRRTIFGRYLYAIGSNESAAIKSGINVRLYTLLVYAACSFCSATGAVVITAWTSSAQPVAAPSLTLQSIAAVVLGGVALTGGSGSMWQVFLGAFVLTLLSNVMNMIGVSAYFQTLAVGVVIIIAVILDRYRRS